MNRKRWRCLCRLRFATNILQYVYVKEQVTSYITVLPSICSTEDGRKITIAWQQCVCNKMMGEMLLLLGKECVIYEVSIWGCLSDRWFDVHISVLYNSTDVTLLYRARHLSKSPLRFFFFSSLIYPHVTRLSRIIHQIQKLPTISTPLHTRCRAPNCVFVDIAAARWFCCCGCCYMCCTRFYGSLY